jgi:hypothetical protein
MDVGAKSLLPSLYKREEFPLFGKEGLGEIFIKVCLFYHVNHGLFNTTVDKNMK